MSVDKSRFYGLDTEQCRAESSRLQGHGEQLSGLMGEVQGMLDSVIWKGKNAERFMGSWEGEVRPAMRDGADELHARSAELKARAQHQDQVSGH